MGDETADSAADSTPRAGSAVVAGMVLLSPPTPGFVSPGAAAAATTPTPPAPRRRSRRVQRLAWAVASTPVGNLFFRRLRGGTPRGARVREFTARNLFAHAADADDEWVDQCVASARDSRGRFATFSCVVAPPRAGF